MGGVWFLDDIIKQRFYTDPWLFDAVHSLSCVQIFATPWNTTCQATLSSTISLSLLKFMSTESVMLSNHISLCHHLLLPSIFPSIRIFSSDLAFCIRWSKYWTFSVSPSREYSGLIFFRMDWFDLLAVQGTLKSLLQHHRLKASIPGRSFFFLSNSHIHTWLLEKP